MNTDELRKEIERLTSLDTIDDLFDLTNIFERFLFRVMESQDFTEKTDREADAMTILQMVFVKLLAARKLLSGVNYNDSETGAKLKKLIDPTTVAAHLQNTFETISMFYIVYVKPENEDERLILYNLWVLSGLNYRQRFTKYAAGEESKQIIKDDQEIIKDLTNQIENSALFKNLDAKNQGKILSAIDENEYKLVFKDNQVTRLSWQDTFTAMNLKSNLFDDNYTYFSFYSHPSNVSVFQFSQMFGSENNAYADLVKYNFKNLMVLLSIFIHDYIELFPDRMKFYESMTLKDQLMIDAFNVLFRGHNKSINGAWKKIL
ncbi:hypothetical protein ACE01N_00915 [Saccharicrinis sp. FJH2]|uniref:hypothetical protein n=1 Tax=Saccharicrinis sp. FJH65 TaxID=3344659 RepID=UPI0035F3E9CE